MDKPKRPSVTCCEDCGTNVTVRARGSIPRWCVDCRWKRNREFNQERSFVDTVKRGTKIVMCAHCGTETRVARVHKASWCDACQSTGLARRDGHYRRRFGVTLKQVEGIVEAQGGACAICKRPPGVEKLNHDHDHRTGQLRGMLCGPCNRALGALGDSEAALLRVIEYLRTPPAAYLYEGVDTLTHTEEGVEK